MPIVVSYRVDPCCAFRNPNLVMPIEMPVHLRFHDNGAILKHHGRVSDEELLEAERAVYEHVYAEKMQFQIVDLRGVTDFAVSANTMRTLGQIDREKAQSLDRLLIVVIAPISTRTMSVIWQAWTQGSSSGEGGIRTEIVNSIGEAQNWLRDQGIDLAIDAIEVAVPT